MKMNFYTMLTTLILLSLAGCRNDPPPKLSIICTLDGLGGGDCVDAAGAQVYKSPSAMKNYWATSQTDEANFTAWCYKTTPATVKPVMAKLKAKMVAQRDEPDHPIPRGENEN